MSIMLLVVSFGLGFACCLMLLGKEEQEKTQRIEELEQENQEFRVKYLDNCWKKDS